jgi:pyridinium-3,5-biscarboxylic acid mononucleotide synthase
LDASALKRLLRRVAAGTASVDEATRALVDLPFASLGYATVDTHRSLRSGFPEVVYGERKSLAQLEGIITALEGRGQPVLVTRLPAETAEALQRRWPDALWHPEARILHLPRGRRLRAGRVAVVCAGTSDIPVAEEAAVTAAAMGAEVARVYDVGVAGLHRLLRRRAELQEAHAAVVVAGMEGALASVVGGLVGLPVVAVPTSVGYGANLGGLSALLTMVNSCAPNVAVVNVDNGFGGGFYAALVSRARRRR